MKKFIVHIDGEQYKVWAKDYQSLLNWTNDIVKKDLADLVEIEYDDGVAKSVLLVSIALTIISIAFFIFA
ncbi:hypothetical protein UFOVP150_61 [uncultured Caudovirales phage]|uniref:Uncharacterized protein n=1 Tax=uncultured Caudovirales phage TaxID=2100421 RepID=A0A6J7W701_9CAUD|nr:hypothetical protein UFOVP150_61 [uncultured Caudovirales phage]